MNDKYKHKYVECKNEIPGEVGVKANDLVWVEEENKVHEMCRLL